MSVSTMKLSRVTLDSLKNLEQDPQSVEKAIEAYQGHIRADRSGADNARRQAESVQNLISTITNVVPKALTELSEIGDKEAFDEWQQSSPEQKEIWRKAVKSGEVAGFHSPMFMNGLEKMVAADHVNKYQESFQQNYVDARNSNDKKYQNDTGEFDFLKWQEHHLHDYSEANGLLNMNPNAYSIFGKGIAPIHSRATAKRAEAKGARAEQKHLEMFGANLKMFLDDPNITPEMFGTKANGLFGEVVDMPGLDTTKYRTMMREVVKQKYIDSVLAGNDDAEQYLEALGNSSTGNGDLKFKGTNAFRKFEREAHAAGDAAWLRKEEKDLQIDKLRVIKEAESIDERWKDFEGPSQEFIRENPDLDELAKKYAHSDDPAEKAISDRIYGMAKGGMDDASYDAHMSNLDPDMTPDEILAQADFLHMSIDQINNLKKVMKARTEMRTGTTGDTTKKHAYDMWNAKDNPKMGEKSVADNPNDVPLLTRDIWHRKHSAELEETMWKIAGLEDVSLEHKQKAAEQAVESYKAGMQKDFDAYTSNQTDVQTISNKKKHIESTQDEWMKSDPKEVSMFLKGDQYIREAEVLQESLLKTREGSNEESRILGQLNRQLLKSNRYRTIAKQYGIDLNLDNVQELQGLVAQTVGRVRNERNLKPAEKKKVQEEVVSSLTEKGWSVGDNPLTNAVLGDVANATTTQSQRGHKTHSNTVTIASQYNAGPPEEQSDYVANIEKREADLMQGIEPEGALENISDMKDAINVLGVEAFGTEIAKNGYEVLDIVNDMREIYAGETYYGTSKSKRSNTGALGEMQVLPSTFKDLVDRGVLGPKFASALGMSIEEVHEISNSEDLIEDFLLTNKKGNYLAAMGKWINMKKAAKGG